ncbi:rhox homeobox family member 1-like, partial [Marmota marmota marmota]|uniref:rhox homeobox family member 1-like n=1 Tax=Marmota marmota marmota TaxID=9994 RepID=UPI0007622806
MANWYQYRDPNYYGLGAYNTEIAAEAEESVAAAAAEDVPTPAAGGHFREGAIGLMEDVIQKGYLNHEGAVNHRGIDYLEANGGKQQPRQEQQAGQSANEAAAVPQPGGTRPRIQYKFSKWQLQELESVFQVTQYPDMAT